MITLRRTKDLYRNENNVIIAHPLLSRSKKEAFLETKAKLKKRLGKDVFLSTGEFLARFIPEKEKRIVLEKNWENLRMKILERLQMEYPFLTYAINRQTIAKVEEKLRAAQLKYEEGRFEDAIKDASVACEGLLQILGSKYGIKTEEATFYDLQCILRDSIIEEFGENTYNDLDMIRKWRNKVVHFHKEKPDEFVTLQIVKRANLLLEIFKKKIFLSTI